MRHHPHSACGLIVGAAILLAAAAARGGWDADAWPSELHPFRGYTQSVQAAEAAAERCVGAGVSATTNAPWFSLFRQRDRLARVKTSIKTARPHYVRPACWNGGATLDAYFLTGTVAALTWTNDTDLCAASSAPTNWLDVTPWFSLNSASNGWRYAPAVFSNLTRTYRQESYYVTNAQDTYWLGLSGVDFTSWASAKSTAQTAWADSGFKHASTIRAYAWAVGQYDAGGPSWSAGYQKYRYNVASFTNAVTNQVDLYCIATNIFDYAGDDSDVFDANGENLAQTYSEYAVAAVPGVTAAVFVVSASSVSTRPNDTLEPDAADPKTSQGYQVSGEFFIHRFDVPGGFAY